MQRYGTIFRTAHFSLMIVVLGACGDGVGNPLVSTPSGLSYALSTNPEAIWFEGEEILVYDRPEKNAMLGYKQWTTWWSDYSLEQWTVIAADHIERSGRDCEIIGSNDFGRAKSSSRILADEHLRQSVKQSRFGAPGAGISS